MEFHPIELMHFLQHCESLPPQYERFLQGRDVKDKQIKNASSNTIREESRMCRFIGRQQSAAVREATFVTWRWLKTTTKNDYVRLCADICGREHRVLWNVVIIQLNLTFHRPVRVYRSFRLGQGLWWSVSF